MMASLHAGSLQWGQQCSLLRRTPAGARSRCSWRAAGLQASARGAGAHTWQPLWPLLDSLMACKRAWQPRHVPGRHMCSFGCSWEGACGLGG